MLYRLLASRSPYRPTDDSARELERAICETDPEPPSAAGPGKGEPGDARAKGRDLAGDLDNIVLMAMRKEPERRYGSVAELSEDLTRYLEGHPVKARKAGWSYRAGKFVLRNKLAVGATAVILALLVGFGVTMSVQAARLAAERDRATRAQETAESTTGFLEDLFKVSDPDESRGDTITAREILDAGEPRIREELEGQPIVQARLLGSIGVVYGNLGLYRDARRILEDALSLREASLPADHPDIAKSLSDLGKVLTEMDEYDEALPVHERALEIRQASLGPGHPQVAQSLVSLGSVLRLQGDFEGARERLQRAIEIYEKSPDTEFDQLRAARNNLAVLYEKMEDYDRSIPMLELVVQETEAELGDDHPDVARGLNNLAVSLARRGDYERALPYLERATAVMEKTLGPDHPQMATAYVNLAFVHGRTGDIERKMELERKALAIEEENLGPDHPRVGMTLINHGRSLLSVNRFAEAQETLERALEILEEGLGADHAHTAGAMRALVEALVFQWKLGGRDGLLERSRQATARQVGEDDPRYADTLFHLGMLSRHDGRDDKAEAHFRRALEIRQQKRPDDPNLSTVLTELAILAARRGNDDEADEHRRQAGEIRGEAPESPKTLYASARYEAARGEREAAMELLQEASGQGYPTDGVERDPDLAILNTGDHRAAQPAL
jgi:serine/threonine-protein kinase